MTRYYLDTEFIDDGKTVELLSIGVVSEDGPTFYAELAEADTSGASDWVRENVLPHLRGAEAQLSRRDLADGLRDFVGHDRPEFWSWCSAYDWLAICQLYGTMMDKPDGWPSYCCDLQQELDRHGIDDSELPPNQGTAHDALADAHWHRDIHRWLLEREAAA